MDSSDSNAPLPLQRIIDLFHTAEREIKKIERLNGNLSIPSINELRYAGYHLACAWQASKRVDDKKSIEEVEKAARHCQRAIYDAHEIGVQYHLTRITQFQDDYRKFPVTDVIKEYGTLRVKVREANEFIQEIAEDHHGDRDQYYERCGEHYGSIKEIADTFDEHRDSINAKIDREQQTTRRWLIGTVITLILGSIVALIKLTH